MRELTETQKEALLALYRADRGQAQDVFVRLMPNGFWFYPSATGGIRTTTMRALFKRSMVYRDRYWWCISPTGSYTAQALLNRPTGEPVKTEGYQEDR